MFNFFRNSSLATKLIGTTLLGGISLLIVGVISFFTLKVVLANYNHVARLNLAKTEQIGELRTHTAMLGVHLNELFSQYLNGDYSGDELPEIDKEITGFNSHTKNYLDLEFVDGEEALYLPVKENWAKSVELIEASLKLYALKDPTQKEKLFQLVAETSIQLENQLSKLNALNSFQHTEAAAWVNKAESSAANGQIISLAAIVTFFIFSILVGLLLSRYLGKTMQQLAKTLNSGADEVSAASLNLSSTAQQLSQATTEQAASIEETAASIEEMASMVGKNSENSDNTAKLASQSQASASRGEEVVREMIASMDDINKSNQNIMSAINQSNNEISEIIKVITEIGNKTKVINDIVFQTKLLSFNASVEAARAGEHGKGFAVVAEEVGNLAQMSGNAAKEISAMLEGSIHKVESIVKDTQNRVEGLIKEGVNRVNQGTSIAHECGKVLHEIVDNVSKVTLMAAEISAASNEQAKGISEISKAMNQLDHVTQQNAQTSDATAQSSDHLSSEAANLKKAVNLLMEEIEGKRFQKTNEIAPKTPKDRSVEAPKNNVTYLKPKALKASTKSHKERTPVHSPAPTLKAAVGAGAPQPTPSFDDSRFEDV